MKQSPLYPEAATRTETSSSPRTALILARMARRLIPAEARPTANHALEPVSSETLVLAQSLAAKLDLDRTRYVRVTSASRPESEVRHRVYLADEVMDMAYSRRHEDVVRPQPTATLTLSGRNYETPGRDLETNVYHCTFGVFQLDDGRRLVQASPSEWAELALSKEYRGAQAAVRELLPEDAARDPLYYQRASRINLGMLDEDGNFTPVREGVNMHAFGADLVGALYAISREGTPTASFDIFEGNVRQYS